MNKKNKLEALKMIEMNKLIVLLTQNHVPFEVIPRKYFEQSYLQICSPSEENCKIDAVSNSTTYGGTKGLIEIYDWVSDETTGWLTAEGALEQFKNVINHKAHKYVVHVSMRFTKNYSVEADSEEEACAIIDNFIDQLDVNEKGWSFADEHKDILEVK